MARIVFDTCVLLAATNQERGYRDVVERIERVRNGEDVGLISTVSVCEFMEKLTRKNESTVAMKGLDYLKLSCFVVVDVTEEIAKLAGPLKARFPQLSTADALIMSTAYAHKAKLYTFDKGFFGIGGVDIIGPRGD